MERTVDGVKRFVLEVNNLIAGVEVLPAKQ